MKGSAAKLLAFLEGADKRYIIPVYQRKYDWKNENCVQLYEDLKRIIRDQRASHFLGSIVSSVVPDGSRIEFHIIDGQQRLTTVTLLLLAISNMIKAERISSMETNLDEQIRQRFIISPWAKEDDKIKLRLVKSDRDALVKLFGDEMDYDRASNLTTNYLYFCDMLLKGDVSVDALYDAVNKLEIISITLDHGDNAQMIFESLNSTGLALQEGDKIRNYILMGLQLAEQDRLYNTYWTKIERCTHSDVSRFIRDYLSIKQHVTPTINNVYQAFKRYSEEFSYPVEALLKDLLCYARLYEKLLTCQSKLDSKPLDDCLYRLNRLDISVARSFFMEVLKLNQVGKLSVDAVVSVFQIIENYLLRRSICEVPTNALNKIFLNLNREILRYDTTTDQYMDKLVYTLLAKKESGRFPDDAEFTLALETKQVYLMRGTYKAYLFERLENYGTIEAKDVYTLLDNGTYTIEHIMPQHLTPAWVEALGPNADSIQGTWLHRLANLTLSGYNPNLSNNIFTEKRDAEVGGYRVSGLRMNQKIAEKDSWGLVELQERNIYIIDYAKKIWSYPSTTFIPAQREFDSCSLDDENVNLTGRDIVKYRYQALEQPVSSWADMLEYILKYLHQRDKSVLNALAYGQGGAPDFAGYVSAKEDKLRSAIKIDEDVYFEKGTSTAQKISILRRLFVLYDADPLDLVFFLRDTTSEKAANTDLFNLRKRYWTFALPVIQDANSARGIYRNVHPSTSNWIAGFFGISGFSVNCVANFDQARVEFWMGSSDVKKNKKAFDILLKHKEEIDASVDIELWWNRADKYKSSSISCRLKGVTISDETDWQRMSQFHAVWSKKLCDTLLPYLG